MQTIPLQTPARFDEDIYTGGDRKGYNITAVDDDDADDQLDVL
jgi:hypothetical protein